MLQIGFNPKSVILSCNMPDVIVFTDKPDFLFKLLADGKTLLQETYYAYNGASLVGNLDSVIEQYMEGDPEHTITEFSIVVSNEEDEEDEVEFTVVFSANDIGINSFNDWAKENFLTLCPIQRIAREGFVTLSWFTTEREDISFRVYATYLDVEGNRGTYFYVHSGNGLIANSNGIKSELVNLSDVVSKIKESKRLDSITLQSVTMRCGNRSATFFIDPSLTGIIPFYYLNNFGLPELFAAHYTTAKKVKSDRSIASLGKTSQFYDVETSKEYEVSTGALTSDECGQMAQLLTSSDVRIPFGYDRKIYDYDFFTLCPILITDYSLETSDSDEKLNSVKFSWRFADNRPKFIAPYTAEVFNLYYNPTFD